MNYEAKKALSRKNAYCIKMIVSKMRLRKRRVWRIKVVKFVVKERECWKENFRQLHRNY